MATVKNSPIPVIVVDGNHEVWPSLKAFQGHGGLPDSHPIRDACSPWRFSLVGLLVEVFGPWNGTVFGALGGAVSVDRFMEGHIWWPEEVTTQDDLNRLLANAPAGWGGGWTCC